MKRFKVTATRTDEYIIEVDEDVYNDEWKASFGSVFHEIDSTEDIVKDLAFSQLRFGSDRFFEGYGNVKRNGVLPYSRSDYDDKGKLLPEDKRDAAAEGLNIILVSEDDDYDFEVEEVQP